MFLLVVQPGKFLPASVFIYGIPHAVRFVVLEGNAVKQLCVFSVVFCAVLRGFVFVDDVSFRVKFGVSALVVGNPRFHTLRVIGVPAVLKVFDRIIHVALLVIVGAFVFRFHRPECSVIVPFSGAVLFINSPFLADLLASPVLRGNVLLVRPLCRMIALDLAGAALEVHIGIRVVSVLVRFVFTQNVAASVLPGAVLIFGGYEAVGVVVVFLAPVRMANHRAPEGTVIVVVCIGSCLLPSAVFSLGGVPAGLGLYCAGIGVVIFPVDVAGPLVVILLLDIGGRNLALVGIVCPVLLRYTVGHHFVHFVNQRVFRVVLLHYGIGSLNGPAERRCRRIVFTLFLGSDRFRNVLACIGSGGTVVIQLFAAELFFQRVSGHLFPAVAGVHNCTQPRIAAEAAVHIICSISSNSALVVVVFIIFPVGVLYKIVFRLGGGFIITCQHACIHVIDLLCQLAFLSGGMPAFQILFLTAEFYGIG